MKSALSARFFRVMAAAITISAIPSVHAAEGGMGDYPLGLMGPQAGYLPDPGTYTKLDMWKYSGDATVSAGKEIPCCAGGLTANAQVKANLDLFANVLSVMHVFEQPVLNGRLAAALVMPYVDADLDVKGNARFVAADPAIPPFTVSQQKTLSDENMGDSIVASVVGWHDGRFHYSAGVKLFMPTGHYDEGKLVNTGRNYWAIDPDVAFTYLNESNGLEFSSDLGLTINQENDYTNYRTGNELHLELAGIQHLSRNFYIGVAGYAYDQVTGDSGAGATLGDFKGKVYGLGPVVGGMIPLNNHQNLLINARYYDESGAENRLSGNALWVTAAINF